MMILLACLLLTPQDTYKLEVRARKGEKFVHTRVETNKGTVKIQKGDQTQNQVVEEREVRKFREEVLDVEGVEATRVKREHLEWFKERKDAGGTADKQIRRLQGKTLILKKKGDETEYEGAEDVPPAELVKNRLRLDPLLSGLPPQAVPVGHEWTLDEAKFKEEMAAQGDSSPFEFSSIKAAARFEKVEERRGARCAVIAITLDSDGTFKNQGKLTIRYKIKTTIYLGLETGRVLETQAEGTGEVAGTADQGGQALQITGKFDIKMEGESKFE